MRTKLALGTKLIAGTVSMLAVSVLISYSGLAVSRTLMQQFDSSVDKTVRKIELADTIAAATLEMTSAQRGAILAAFAKDGTELDNYKTAFGQNVHALQAALAELRPLLVVPEGIALVADISERVSAWQPHYDELAQRCAAGDVAGANRIRKDIIGPLYKKIDADARRIAAIQAETLAENKTALDHVSSQGRWIALALLGLSILVGMIVLFIVRNVGSTLNRFSIELAEGAEQVANAASQVSSASQSLAQGSSQQAASLEETSASTEEINAMAQRNTSDCRAAADLAAQSEQKCAETNVALNVMTAAMGEINSSSEKISKIIKVIEEIAFQTNILALNAAVEAARAGESGMGFAVVADEVRNLAQRCAQAAKDTASLIEESILKSQDGKQKLDDVVEGIRGITAGATQAKNLMEAVNAASQEQSRGIAEVGKAVSQMDRVTQTTAATAEESAAAAEQLTAQSHAVKAIVVRLEELVHGVSS